MTNGHQWKRTGSWYDLNTVLMSSLLLNSSQGQGSSETTLLWLESFNPGKHPGLSSISPGSGTKWDLHDASSKGKVGQMNGQHWPRAT